MPKKILASLAVVLLAVSTLFAQDIRRAVSVVNALTVNGLLAVGISGASDAGPFTMSGSGNSAEIRLSTGAVTIGSSATGQFLVEKNDRTIGVQVKVDALPTINACGAGAPAVTAGSTPYSGTATVGTGGPTSCAINFNGTAFTTAPQCDGSMQTATPANIRQLGYSASTTVLTITPATAFTDSTVVSWHCPANK